MQRILKNLQKLNFTTALIILIIALLVVSFAAAWLGNLLNPKVVTIVSFSPENATSVSPQSTISFSVSLDEVALEDINLSDTLSTGYELQKVGARGFTIKTNELVKGRHDIVVTYQGNQISAWHFNVIDPSELPDTVTPLPNDAQIQVGERAPDYEGLYKTLPFIGPYYSLERRDGKIIVNFVADVEIARQGALMYLSQFDISFTDPLLEYVPYEH